MTGVSFHTGVDDPVDYACRLLRKGHRQGARIQVVAPAVDLGRLDHLLWVFDPQDFVPHVHLRTGQPVPDRLHRTPVWLVDPDVSWPVQVPLPQMLLRWGQAEAVELQGWERVIEIVSNDAPDRQAARQRWRAYEASGATLQHHSA
jgi:DNA polymerase-3 subunit chi